MLLSTSEVNVADLGPGQTATVSGTAVSADGEWVDVCPTDAIDLDGVTRTLEFEQVVYPGGDSPARGGQLGFYTGPVDAETVSAVVSNLGGIAALLRYRLN